MFPVFRLLKVDVGTIKDEERLATGRHHSRLTLWTIIASNFCVSRPLEARMEEKVGIKSLVLTGIFHDFFGRDNHENKYSRDSLFHSSPLTWLRAVILPSPSPSHGISHLSHSTRKGEGLRFDTIFFFYCSEKASPRYFWKRYVFDLVEIINYIVSLQNESEAIFVPGCYPTK